MDFLSDLKNIASADKSLAPASRVSNTNGAGIDLVNGTIRTHAVVSVGALTDNAVPYAVIEESDDNTTFAAVADPGANTGNVNANTVTVLSFLRTKRYVRGVAKIASGGANQAVISDVVILAPKKNFGAGTGASSGVDRSPSS